MKLPAAAAPLLVAGLAALAGCEGSAAPQGCPGAAGCRATGGRDGAAAGSGGRDATAGDTAVAPGLVAQYAFDEAGGSVAIDSSGNFRNGGLIDGVAWGVGRSGADVSLGGGYLVLPPGMLDQASAFSVTAWVKLRTDRIWQRIMDFGSGTNSYLFLTPHSDHDSFRFAITRGGAAAEQRVEVAGALPLGVWKHVAVVLTAGGAGILYLDGQPVASNPALTLRPSDIGPLGNDWIGRSQFSYDPLFDGEIDQVRIYDRALSSSEVLASFEQP